MASTKASICTDVDWIEVINPTTEEMQKLSDHYGLNPYTVRDCLQPEHLPKYESIDDVHFLILRYYAPDKNDSVITIQELTNKVAIFYTDRFLITIHKTDIPFLTMLRGKFVSAQKCSSATDLLLRIVWNALETFDEPANKLSEDVDEFESQVMKRKLNADLSNSLYTIKREASIANKVLMLMLEPINHIHIRSGEEAALQDVRDQHLKMHTFYLQVLEDVNNLMNLSLSFSAQHTNDVMRVLTIFSVFFMPLTFIAGIYGMNFQHMPELTKQWGYPAVLAAMALVTIVIFLWMKRKKWL